MLFGKKQETIELEEKLEDCRKQLDELNEKVRKAKKLGEDTTASFASQIAAQNEMDKQLTKVVASAHQSIAASKESQQGLEKLMKDLAEIRGQIEDEEYTKQNLVGALDECLESLLSFGEDSDHPQETPVHLMKKWKGELKRDLRKLGSQVSEMQEFSRQMKVLCLQNAVEAGRMGEGGRKLVESAQKVQLFAGEYEKAVERALEQQQEMEGHISGMEEELEKLTDGIQVDSKCLDSLAKKLEKQVNVCGELSKNRFSDKLYGLSSVIRQLTQNQEGIRSLQQDTLSEMENIGESFMDGQEARKELERVFDEIMKLI